MKCALELLKISEEKRKEIELELENVTIAECERIGKILEDRANKGKEIRYIFYLDSYGKPMYETNLDYADKRTSFCYSSRPKIDFNIMVRYFKNYCFDIDIKKFNYYMYGCGFRYNGMKVTISPIPECLE